MVARDTADIPVATVNGVVRVVLSIAELKTIFSTRFN
jgi:hypothetical protein